MNKEISIEIQRQGFHLFGALASIVPIALLNFHYALNTLAIFILLALITNWYIEKRRLRDKYFREFIAGLKISGLNKTQLLRGLGKSNKILLDFARQFKRKKEKQPVFSILTFLLSGTICFILFGKEIAIFAFLALGFGDAFSALIGKRFGKTKIPWNKELSVQGSLAFFAVTSIAIYLFLLWQPQFAIMPAIAIALIAALTGALTETIPTANDNATIPIAVGLILYLFSLFS